MPAKSAVADVPRFAPRIIGRAPSIVTKPCWARIARVAMGIAEDCIIAVRIKPNQETKEGIQWDLEKRYKRLTGLQRPGCLRDEEKGQRTIKPKKKTASPADFHRPLPASHMALPTIIIRGDMSVTFQTTS